MVEAERLIDHMRLRLNLQGQDGNRLVLLGFEKYLEYRIEDNDHTKNVCMCVVDNMDKDP